MCLFITLLSGCSKEAPSPGDIENSSLKNVESREGVLIFPSWKTADGAASWLKICDFKDVIDFGKSKNFLSQHQILHDVYDEEEKLLVKSLVGFENIETAEEAVKSGYVKPGHSALYTYAVNKKIIKIIADQIDDQSYTLNSIDPTLAPILSADGLIYVGDTLWQFTENQIKFAPASAITGPEELMEATDNEPRKGIVVFTKSENGSRGSMRNDWNYCPSFGCGNWKTNGNYRAQNSRTGWSEMADCGTICYAKFYTSIWAQKKQAFIWWTTNNYVPTYTYNGSWTASNRVSLDPYCCVSFCSSVNYGTPAFGVTGSPMYNRQYTANLDNEAVPLHPHVSGYWIGTNGYKLVEPYNVTNQQITTSCANVGSLD